MTDDERNLLARREILVAYTAVLDRLDELLEVCSAVTGDTDDLRRAVEEAFDLSPIQADAILAIQVRRFTPNERRKLEEELVELELLRESSG